MFVVSSNQEFFSRVFQTEEKAFEFSKMCEGNTYPLCKVHFVDLNFMIDNPEFIWQLLMYKILKIDINE